MIILSIETSCDETAVSIIEAEGGMDFPSFRILGNALYSQAETHAEFGGVMPSLAKREHSKNIVPLFLSAMQQAIDTEVQLGKKLELFSPSITEEQKIELQKVLAREEGTYDKLLDVFSTAEFLNIDCIAVTEGPGLEPALWVGISFAKALANIFSKPLVPVNHMEGHIVSVLLSSSNTKDKSKNDQVNEPSVDQEEFAPKIKPIVRFPALALLISGGHTELIEADGWHSYKIIGQTCDDAIGEAFDKVARLMGLSYPGGPKVSKLAKESREEGLMEKLTRELDARPWTLPRPMLKSPDFNFSFSGIKTSVLYAVREKTKESTKTELDENSVSKNTQRNLTEDERKTLCEEFENAVTEVLVSKTERAIKETGAKTLIIGGGVVANSYIREKFEKMVSKYEDTNLFVPSLDMSTDNSVMIGVAGYLRYLKDIQNGTTRDIHSIKATGNLSLA